MKYIFGLVLFGIMLFSACDDNGNGPEIIDYPCIDMKVGDECIIDNDLTIRFEQIVEDSRCPSSVVCVWEGRAGVELVYIFQKDMLFVDTLYHQMGINEVSETQFNQYHITLTEVYPYPPTPTQIPMEDYRINLDVSTDWFDANITGYDLRLCPAPCCGGLLIELDGTTYSNYNYEEISGIVLDNPTFPIPIKIRYTFDTNWPCMLILTEVN